MYIMAEIYTWHYSLTLSVDYTYLSPVDLCFCIKKKFFLIYLLMKLK